MASDWYANWIRENLPKPVSYKEQSERRKAYMRDYYIRNKDKKREYDRRRYLSGKKKRTPRKPEHEYKDCELCGMPFYPYHFSDKYCSKTCRERVMSKRKYERGKVDVR